MRICTAFIYRVFRNNGVFFKNFHYFETSPSQAVSTGLLVTVKFSWSICRRGGMGCSWQLKSTILPEHPLCGCKNLFFLIAINFLWPCLSVRRVGLLVGRLVGLFVIIYWKGRKFYFHAPNGHLFFLPEYGLEIIAIMYMFVRDFSSVSRQFGRMILS